MSVKFSRLRNHLELNDQITFGTHFGRTISYMLEFEPEYLLWATRQPGLISLSSTAASKLEEKALRAKLEKEQRKAKMQTYMPGDQEDYWEDVPY